MTPDGFGNRTFGVDSERGDEVELLDLSTELVEHAEFVAALAERVARFASVRHASYAHLRRLDRPASDRLELVSERTPGWRLSDLLIESHAAGTPIDITIVIGLLRQLLPAVALYSRHNRDTAIGALAVERLIVTPQGRLVIAEHAFGPALEKLNLGREKLWRRLRVAMPPSAGLPRANQRADAHAIGLVALSLLLGRPLTLDEFPAQLQELVAGAQEYRDGAAHALSAPFADWLTRALQFEVSTAFQGPSEAQLAFEAVLASDRAYVTSSAKLDAWLASVGATLDGKRRPKPDPEVLRSKELEREHAREGIEARSPVAPARSPLMYGLAAAVILLLVVVGWLATRGDGGMRDGEGELAVQSRPQGARVVVDGQEQGVTPLTVRLNAGAHVLEVQVGTSEPRVIPLNIQAGVQTSQYIELQGVTASGTLEVRSEPSGARVLVDGRPRGTTPATVRDLSVGDHTVVVEAGSRKATQIVKIDAGSTAQLVVPLPRR